MEISLKPLSRFRGPLLIHVRGPFVAEGVLQGGIGALVALGVLWVGFTAGQLRHGDLAADLLGVEGMSFLPWSLSGLLIVEGMAVGCVAGLMAGSSTREVSDG